MFANLVHQFRGDTADSIGHDELVEAIASNSVTVVDVREAGEFMTGAIAGAINAPLSVFDPGRIPTNKPVVVYCMSGARSGMAQQALRSAGFRDVRNYKPGIGMWRLQGGAIT